MTRIALALAFLAVTSTVALADDDDHGDWHSRRWEWVSEGQVARQLETQGYWVRKIEEDDGRYKVKVVTPDRHKEKLYVSPRSGEVIGVSPDNDDYDYDED